MRAMARSYATRWDATSTKAKTAKRTALSLEILPEAAQPPEHQDGIKSMLLHKRNQRHILFQLIAPLARENQVRQR